MKSKKRYIQPLTEVVIATSTEICVGTVRQDNLSENPLNPISGTIEDQPNGEEGAPARITWGNLWAEEEQDFYAYTAWE